MTASYTLDRDTALVAECSVEGILVDNRRRHRRRLLIAAFGVLVVALACGYAGVLDPRRYTDWSGGRPRPISPDRTAGMSLKRASFRT